MLLGKIILANDSRSSTAINHTLLIKESGLSPYIVESCVNELYFLGVFSYTARFTNDGRQSLNYSEGTPAHTELTSKFIKFISDPAENI